MPRRSKPEDEIDSQRDTLVDAKHTRRGVGAEDAVIAKKRRRRDPADAKLVGSMFGAYLVQEELGGGAMGVVFRAAHIDTNRVVALKVLRPALLDEPATVERFVREARLASRLGHPHIGGVFEMVKQDERYGLAMELVDGEPLSSIVTMPLPPERVTLLVAQLLRALEHAHAAGLVHRDLKPDNVLVEWRNGRDHARIIDFGIAIAREGGPDSVQRLTGVGQIVGTPAYMSPEQARAEELDQRSDLYSLGVMMYEMLAAELPFDGRPADVLTAKLRRDPPRLEERVPGLLVDPLLERFCFKLLGRRPEQRFRNARHALKTLELLGTDRAAAGLELGEMDVQKALDLISLHPPKTR
ncbi:MAG TPA: serine/threonine-protein kinase [Kofleriaceae bacterium]|nr:serine/threonine-protein kinase [Kofleriaceae bacterium]